MGILAEIRRLFTGIVSHRPSQPSISTAGARSETFDKPVGPVVPAPVVTGSETEFVPSFQPFKARKMPLPEWESKGRSTDNYPWRYEYGNELFRSNAEVEWAKTFDQMGLAWVSEPLKFDMGPIHVSYTPDFIVAGLIPDSNRALYVEIKRFPDAVDLTKYVRFTEWYNCDLLVLAHQKGGMLKPRKEKHFIIFRCAHCNTYDCFSCNGLITEDHLLPFGSPVCQVCQGPFTRMVVPNYFLIQAGIVGPGRLVLSEREQKRSP